MEALDSVSGECNMLVATSVAEEGRVQLCDSVPTCLLHDPMNEPKLRASLGL